MRQNGGVHSKTSSSNKHGFESTQRKDIQRLNGNESLQYFESQELSNLSVEEKPSIPSDVTNDIHRIDREKILELGPFMQTGQVSNKIRNSENIHQHSHQEQNIFSNTMDLNHEPCLQFVPYGSVGDQRLHPNMTGSYLYPKPLKFPEHSCCSSHPSIRNDQFYTSAQTWAERSNDNLFTVKVQHPARHNQQSTLVGYGYNANMEADNCNSDSHDWFIPSYDAPYPIHRYWNIPGSFGLLVHYGPSNFVLPDPVFQGPTERGGL